MGAYVGREPHFEHILEQFAGLSVENFRAVPDHSKSELQSRLRFAL